jgi:hypothetical protein
VKRRKRFCQKGPLPQSWLDTNLRPAFRGYPVATVAFYGPNDKLATQIVVSVILTESNEPDVLHRKPCKRCSGAYRAVGSRWKREYIRPR